MPRNSAQLQFGAGRLWIGPLGTTEPVDPTTAPDAAFTDLGYTEDGSQFGSQVTSENIFVAEELDPIKTGVTGRVSTVAFSLAQITAANLKTAYNGGTINTAAGVTTFDPPAIGAEIRVMLLWDADDATERWVFRQCFQTGSAEIPRRKAPAKALIPVTFTLEKPTGLQPFRAIFDDARED